MLTYTKETFNGKWERKEIVVKVPKQWGLLKDSGGINSSGNQAFSRKAQKLMNTLEKITQERPKDSYSQKIKAFDRYMSSYAKCRGKKSYSGCTDTMVREAVWCFAVKCGEAVGVEARTLDEIWRQYI